MQATFQKRGEVPARTMQELAHRLGQDVLPDISSSVTNEDIASLHGHPALPESSFVARDVSQDFLSSAAIVPHESSHDADQAMQEKYDSVGSPLFAMMGPKDASSGQKTTRSKKNITVERKGGNQLNRSEDHTSKLQSHLNLVCRLLL